MANLDFHKNARGQTVYGREVDMAAMTLWRPTVAQVREVIQRHFVVGSDFSAMPIDPVNYKYAPSQREVEAVERLAHDAVRYGRMIDFGYLPNAVIKQGGERGGPLWNAGGLGQPFTDPWILYHTWDVFDADGAPADEHREPGAPAEVAVYLINPLAGPFGNVEVCELQPASFNDEKLLVISDRGVFFVVEGALPENKYECSITPSMLRFMTGPAQAHADVLNNNSAPAAAAAGNIGDPLMTALLILNTRGVDRETVVAPEKVNRARARKGAPLIPNYDRVNSGPYVTAIMARRSGRQGVPKGGTHASPTPHLRLGHPRTYSSGRSIFIQDTLVNVTEEQRKAFRSNRSHYAIRKG